MPAFCWTLKSHPHALIFPCGAGESAFHLRHRCSGARIRRSCWAPFRSLDCLLFALTRSCSTNAPRRADLGARNGADSGETSGSVLGPVAALGKQHNWGLKQKRVSPRPGRPALPEASSSFWWSQASLGLWSHPSSLCLHCYVASSCVSVSRLLEGQTFGFGAIRIIQDDLTSRSLTHYTCKDPDVK